jgi:hypothetical protein
VDDHLDLAVAGWRGTVKVYWGDGTGGFSAPQDLIAAGDFNITTKFARCEGPLSGPPGPCDE